MLLKRNCRAAHLGSARTHCKPAQRYTAVIRRSFRIHASKEVPRLVPEVDDKLSNRWIDLDEAGYFIIKIDRDAKTIIAEHYTNTINKDGQACDPVTGKPIACSADGFRLPSAVYTGVTAKELSVKLCEEAQAPLLTRLEHANYLGRECQRAEFALITGDEYVQD